MKPVVIKRARPNVVKPLKPDELLDADQGEPTRADTIQANIDLRKTVIDKIQKELPFLNRAVRSAKTPRKIRMARALHKTRSDKLVQLKARNERLQTLLKDLNNGNIRK